MDNQLMKPVTEQTLTAVSQKIEMLTTKGELDLPKDYSVANALKSAWLILQGVKNKDKMPVLQTCTRDSIIRALMDMCIQGLNPIKKQCYFIAYGKALGLQPSYFGAVTVARRFGDIKDVTAHVVFDGDDLEYEVTPAGYNIVKHKQNLKNRKNPIVAAYATIHFTDGSTTTDLMDWNQIIQSWKQSIMNPVTDKGELRKGTTHAKFPEEMAKRTVIARACKRYINTSNDAPLVAEAFNRQQDLEHDLETGEIIEAELASEVVTLDDQPETPTPDPEEAQPKERDTPQQVDCGF